MDSPLKHFQTIISRLITDRPGWSSPTGLDISGQFSKPGEDLSALFRKLNAAFLILLAGKSHPDHGDAFEFLETQLGESLVGAAASFYRAGLRRIEGEILKTASRDIRFSGRLSNLSSSLFTAEDEGKSDPFQKAKGFWSLFFPEGVSGLNGPEAGIEQLRKKRKVRITRLNPNPIKYPSEEILFTSNILLTLPSEPGSTDQLPLSPAIRHILKKTAGEEQRYWYDHPIPIGVKPEHNEALYGLKGLSEALQFEKERGQVEDQSRLKCLLSVSVTHEGLQPIAREYISETLKSDGAIRNIDVYVFTEIDAGMLVDEVLVPAAKRYAPDRDSSVLKEIFGTDGEYGRHYSFLKAISALWQVLIDPEIKATFKIDLDQVFPQKELVEQSGASAFEHFKTPLWGAEGTDEQGRAVDLGMLAGALVNQKDIHHGIFTPDINFPSGPPKADELIFFSKLLQALSTEAEMMTRYGEDGPDGREECIQRIHVTGGTNGILVRALRLHRPFTPVFIGRAEDQAYLLSVLFPEKGPALRYVHKDGLIMRHDKEAMAVGAIKAAATGKLIGDYVRIITFSSYADALPWSLDKIKETVDPFTGCFISKIPLTVVYLRCALKAASFFGEGNPESDLKGKEFLDLAIERLSRAFKESRGDPNPLLEIYKREKEAWNLYYDLLDAIEGALKKDEAFALELKEKAGVIVQGCRIRT